MPKWVASIQAAMELDTKRAEDPRALWDEYRRSGDRGLRDRLIMTYAPLVKYIVYKKVRELPAHCDVDDFISCGLEALMSSLDRYDPQKGATLEQFAWTRVHGAVIDELRRQDWAPRSVRRWERDIARARARFVALHERHPSREELADLLGTTPAELQRREGQVATSDVTSLNSLVIGDDDAVAEKVDTLASDDSGLDPEQAAVSAGAKEPFRREFELLPRREREVAIMLYVNDLTLREVGEVLGVSESRVCQIHGQLKRKLRRALMSESDLLAEVA